MLFIITSGNTNEKVTYSLGPIKYSKKLLLIALSVSHLAIISLIFPLISHNNICAQKSAMQMICHLPWGEENDG